MWQWLESGAHKGVFKTMESCSSGRNAFTYLTTTGMWDSSCQFVGSVGLLDDPRLKYQTIAKLLYTLVKLIESSSGLS